ncbi:hypothetical protein QVD17_18350 [Tagetes erecta]|uniref:Uncharacterized protein n=1 Tax=Tagetes erecta TaxID=13708 RepID=A0AAD8KKZ5_TARER|nr:hypothetical protein QVD17_18350 [Tagetes erecta]
MVIQEAERMSIPIDIILKLKFLMRLWICKFKSLLTAYGFLHKLNYQQISKLFKAMRTAKGETKTSLKKGAWSAEEDRKLIAYINRYGIWNWSHMPKYAGLLRSGKSCRLRWMNYLKPDLKKGSFSDEEEQSILHFHSILGNRWSAIARKLPGRSDNEIKNYWHTNLKKRVTNNPVHKGSKKKETSTPQCFGSHNVEKLDNDNDISNSSIDIDNFLFSWASEDDNSSSSTTPTTEGQQVEFTPDIGSPGTVEDLQCFWRELYTLEDLDLANIIDQEIFVNEIFQDPYDDTIPWSFYNDEQCYDTTPTTII